MVRASRSGPWFDRRDRVARGRRRAPAQEFNSRPANPACTDFGTHPKVENCALNRARLPSGNFVCAQATDWEVPNGPTRDRRRLIHGSGSADAKKSACAWILAISYCREGMRRYSRTGLGDWRLRVIPHRTQAAVDVFGPHRWEPMA